MKSYLKFLSRNKLYTAIEAVGLAVSLAFVIIIALLGLVARSTYYADEKSRDIAVLLSGLIAFVSVIWQVLKAAKANPAIELKKE